MTAREFIESIKGLRKDTVIGFNPPLALGPADGIAADILQKTMNDYPHLTIGQLEEAFHQAQWWLTFWASAELAQSMMKEEK